MLLTAFFRMLNFLFQQNLKNLQYKKLHLKKKEKSLLKKTLILIKVKNYQAMVARAHQHLGGVQHRGFGAQDHTQAQRQALQQAQRSQGLGLVVNEVLQAVGQRGIMQVSNGWKYER